jgi:hypothetical protein
MLRALPFVPGPLASAPPATPTELAVADKTYSLEPSVPEKRRIWERINTEYPS